MKKQRLLTASLLGFSSLVGFSSLALAHPGHGLETAYAGFMHPMTGWDHLLVMLAIGLWAANIGGRARWLMPLTFVSAMAVGAILGQTGFYFTEVEAFITASVMLIGAILMFGIRLNDTARMLVVATVALFHGMAHGAEIQANQTGTVIMAMLFATALLHSVGFLLGNQSQKVSKLLQFGLAGMMLLLGGISLIN